MRRDGGRRIAPAALAGMLLFGVTVVGAGAAATVPVASVASATTQPEYYLALGDSLACGWGTGGTSWTSGSPGSPNCPSYSQAPAAGSYVASVYNQEKAALPGLQFEGLDCAGESTAAFVSGSNSFCYTPAGSQLSNAVNFLTQHKGQVAVITITIGADDGNNGNASCNDPASTGNAFNGTFGLTYAQCVNDAIAQVNANLPIILSQLHQADPGAPIVGTSYYDANLNTYFASPPPGCTDDPSCVTDVQWASNLLFTTLQSIYANYGAKFADVASAFQTNDSSPTGSYGGFNNIPLNVANVCNWTWNCPPIPGPLPNIHPNDTGYQVISNVVDPLVASVVTLPVTPTPTPTPATHGYDLVGSDGGVFVFGGGFYGSLPGIGVKVNNIKGIVPTTTDNGYFLVGSDGGVFAFNAPFANSLPGIGVHVNNIVGIVPTLDDSGYFLVGSDGGVFSFNAPFANSLPGIGVHVNNIVGIAATSDDQGYWLVGSDGKVYAFGDAHNYGSAPAGAVGITVTHDGGGYWVVGANGAVTAFGDAGKFGDLPGLGVNVSNIVGIVVSPDSQGYNLFGSDGGVFSFGDQPNLGSLPGLGVHVNNVVGAVPT